LIRKNRYFELSVIEFAVSVGILLLSILLFSIIADEVVVENKVNFDTSFFTHIASYVTPFNTKAALLITFFGSGSFLIPAYIILIASYVVKRKIREALMIGIVAFVSLLSGWLLKDLFHRARPLHPLISGAGGYSFPSGHSLGGFTFSGVIIYLLSKTSIPIYLKWILSILLVLFAILIGLSRIYLHVHYASDVLGSLFVTAIWLSLTFVLNEAIAKKSIKEK
jgi:undecaprenyl-diphosphatase